MGIYIKGMEMPTSCRACHLKMNCDDCEGWECVCVPLRKRIGYLDDLLMDKRRDDCPLVPVPPHGRPVVKASWKRIDFKPCGHDYECSSCGWKNDMATHFCPNCGADMREKSDEKA